MNPLAIFLFPDSPKLRTRWWHRLALVSIWLWICAVVIRMLNALIVQPYDTCMRVKTSQYSDGTLDCGRNIADYALMNMADSGIGQVLFGAVILAVVFFIAVALPSLAYRVILYIATGQSWKNVSG